MTDHEHDDTPANTDEGQTTGRFGATLHDAARATRPRAGFVNELETHLRRQSLAQPPPIRRAWGGFRALVLAAVVALGLGALVLGAGTLRPAAAPSGTVIAPTVAPTATVATGNAVLPAGASTAVSLGAAAGLTAWVPSWLGDPTIVYLLLMLGALAVLLEALHPGAFVPGLAGGAALLLGVVGLLTLPLNWAGLLLLLVALALVVADIQASTHGALTLAALVAFVPGSLLLFGPQSPGGPPDAVALPAVLALAALLGAFGLGVGALAARTHALPPYRYALPEGGMVGTAVGPLAPTGVVQVAGQLWSARADSASIAAAQPVRVLVREGLTLVVQPLEPGAAGESEFPDVDR